MISWSHSQVGTSLSLDVLEGSHQIVLLASESQDDCLNRCCAPELETTPHPTGHAPCFPPRIKEILPVLHSTWATWQQTSDDSRGSTDLCSKVKSFLHSLDTFEAAPGIHRRLPSQETPQHVVSRLRRARLEDFGAKPLSRLCAKWSGLAGPHGLKNIRRKDVTPGIAVHSSIVTDVEMIPRCTKVRVRQLLQGCAFLDNQPVQFGW